MLILYINYIYNLYNKLFYFISFSSYFLFIVLHFLYRGIKEHKYKRIFLWGSLQSILIKILISLLAMFNDPSLWCFLNAKCVIKCVFVYVCGFSFTLFCLLLLWQALRATFCCMKCATMIDWLIDWLLDWRIDWCFLGLWCHARKSKFNVPSQVHAVPQHAFLLNSLIWNKRILLSRRLPLFFHLDTSLICLRWVSLSPICPCRILTWPVWRDLKMAHIHLSLG